jgi:hypothetical protein
VGPEVGLDTVEKRKILSLCRDSNPRSSSPSPSDIPTELSRPLLKSLDDRGYRVRFPAGAGNFSLHHRVQNGSGAHPASYSMGTRATFSRGKAAEA